MLDCLGVRLPYIYMHCPRFRYSIHLCLIDWGVHLPSIYMHCPRSSSGCSSMQGIYAWLTGGSICLLYICIVLDLAVGVAVCKASVLNWLREGHAGWMCNAVFNASMLDWLGVHLPSIYMHCPRSSSGGSGMQDICAWLTGEGYMKCNVFRASMLNYWDPSAFYIQGHMKCNGIQCIYAWLTREVHLPSIYMHCPRSSSGCSSMQGICAQLTGEDLCWIALCYANIFGVAVFNASMLDWLGGPSVFYIYALS